MLRRVVIGLGALVTVYGLWLLVSRQSLSQIVNAIEWLAAGVLLHDAVLAPIAILLGWLAARALPRPLAAAAAVVLILLGPVTLLAVPVLGRFGARSDNPTLLDRDYGMGWAMFAALTVLVGALVGLRSRRASRVRRGDGARARRGRRPDGP